jgi:hypothetical protein
LRSFNAALSRVFERTPLVSQLGVVNVSHVYFFDLIESYVAREFFAVAVHVGSVVRLGFAGCYMQVVQEIGHE